ncbi:PBPRA1643 family SWIM/SEC-C metal-binding motif protein [Motiliproteus sp. MSK22-1]|uniref:PBPRA1643 family SWIM/SEC-C metal-binding motif protein n=1 Tax=Motiliproteus sp. MSK22-1 TaxID=1897630 RepID=UPI0009777BD8|nr:PBPRA1643 family SWIM/SEC-C metal-binding motif protein [Motiliproteus sp. MSK22-1]OMH31725.1 zinc chelation protein SecC [Motiliproteus sp. MSK22-1]
MSKFFFKGRIEKREDYEGKGFNTKRAEKLGTEKFPLSLTVVTEARKTEIEAILEENSLYGDIAVNEEAEENIVELEVVLNKPKTMVLEKTPNRNDPCSCGSGKKYKKCCG